MYIIKVSSNKPFETPWTHLELPYTVNLHSEKIFVNGKNRSTEGLVDSFISIPAWFNKFNENKKPRRNIVFINAYGCLDKCIYKIALSIFNAEIHDTKWANLCTGSASVTKAVVFQECISNYKISNTKLSI